METPKLEEMGMKIRGTTIWQERRKKFSKQSPPARALVRREEGKCQILIEIDRTCLIEKRGGEVVIVADVDIPAESFIFVHDLYIKPRVVCQVVCTFPKGVLAKLRRRRNAQYARADSPVLFTSL